MFNIATTPKPAAQGLLQDGLSLLQPTEFKATLGLPAADWQNQWPALADSWNRLPPDTHLRDGGHYRQRRHACYLQTLADTSLQAMPHRAHWQPTDYNALHG
ncbi:MAG: 2OG-Fe dioxygenase family protein, partial [Polaromonas sp.]|nr:2OG-Fe dioxygenase family protein [Polaromonas sp.]